MKTTSQKNNSGAREQIRNIEQTNTSTAAHTAPVAQAKPDNRLPIDHEARKTNRTLATPVVLARLRELAPTAFEAAEVVGQWVWVHFTTTPAPELRQSLAQLGFHWNSTRAVWQHPCGKFTGGNKADPREHYETRPAAQVAA